MPSDSSKATKARKARVLLAFTIGARTYQPNDVGSFDAATLGEYSDALDADPAAVKYAESLKASDAAE